jgi:excisionase family DNA binding protein
MASDQHHTPPLLLTLRETARLLRLSQRTVWQYAHDGKLPCVRFGRALRFPRKELEEWLAQMIGQPSCGGDQGATNDQ